MGIKVILFLGITHLVLLSGLETSYSSVKDRKEKKSDFYELGTYTPGYEQLLSSSKEQTVMSVLDPSLIMIWFIGVFSVAARAYILIPSATSTPIVKIRLTSVPVIVVMVCVWILFIYFCTMYAAYLVITLFAVLTVRANFVCMDGILNRMFPHLAEYRLNTEHLIKSKLQISSIFILIISVCLSTAWVVLRNECRVWILQAFLSVCLCVTVVRVTFVANLKMGLIFLMVVLIYDVLMVFIPTGEGVIEQLAIVATTVIDTGVENIPLTIKIPNLVNGSFTLCGKYYRLLGIGDILLPGCFVSFCRNFDIFTASKTSIYLVTSCIGYGFGLLMVFLAVELTSFAQPALLYLCPSMLMAVVSVGLYRDELGMLWKGIPTETAEDTSEDEILPFLS